MFGLHLLIWLIVRLAVGVIYQTPPAGTYEGLWAWGLLVFGHWLLLSILEARDRVALPFGVLNRLVVPRERRWMLLIIDVMLWFISEAGVSGLLFPYYFIARHETLFSLLWLVQTIVVVAHLGLVVYAELHDRIGTKRKNDEKTKSSALLPADDGELIDFPITQITQPTEAKVKHER